MVNVLYFNVVTAGQFTTNFEDVAKRELDVPTSIPEGIKHKRKDTAEQRYSKFTQKHPTSGSGNTMSLSTLWRKEFLDTTDKLRDLITKHYPRVLVLCFDGDPPGSPPAVLVHYLFTIFSLEKTNLDIHILQCQSEGDYDIGVFMDGNFPCIFDEYNKQISPSEMPKLHEWLTEKFIKQTTGKFFKSSLTRRLKPFTDDKFHTLEFKGWSEAYSKYGVVIPQGAGPDCKNLDPPKYENKFEFNKSGRSSRGTGILITNMGDRVLPQDVGTFKGDERAHYDRCVGGNLGVWNYFFKTLKLSPTDRSPDFKTFLTTNIPKLQRIIDIGEFHSYLLISNVLPIIELLKKEQKYHESITSQTFKWATAAEAARTEHLKLLPTTDSLTDEELVAKANKAATAAPNATVLSGGSRLRKRTRSRRRFNKRVSKSRRSIKRRQRRSKKRRMKKLKSRR